MVVVQVASENQHTYVNHHDPPSIASASSLSAAHSPFEQRPCPRALPSPAMGSPRAPPGWSAGASERAGSPDLPLVALLGEWADMEGSSYRVSRGDRKDCLSALTRRPNGKTRKTENLIRVRNGTVSWASKAGFFLDDVALPCNEVCWRPTRGRSAPYTWFRTHSNKDEATCGSGSADVEPCALLGPGPSWVLEVLRRQKGKLWTVGKPYFYDKFGHLRRDDWQADESGRLEVLMGWMPRTYLERVPTKALPWAPVCKVLSSFNGPSWSSVEMPSGGYEYLDVRMGDRVVDVHAALDVDGWANVARVRWVPGGCKSDQDGNLIHGSTASGTALP